MDILAPMKRGALLLLVFLLSMTLVAAGEGVTISEVDSNTILQPDEKGTYILEIKNEDTGKYQLQIKADAYAGLPTSDIEFIFANPNYLVLEGKESAEILIEIKLKENVPRQKRYKTYIDVTSVNNNEVDERYELQVFAMEPTDPITLFVSESSETVSPGNSFLLILGLENNLDKDLNNLEIYVSSDIFEDQRTIELFKDQEKTTDFIFEIDNSVEPGDYSYNVRVYYEENLEASLKGEFSVEENLDIVEYSKTITDFLFSQTTVIKQNNGNSEVTESYTYTPGLIESWFSDYNIEPNYDIDSITGWTFNVSPGEEYTITITVDYRPVLVGLIVLLLLAAVFYFVFTKRVSIKKEVFKLKYSQEGLADFKVLLHVKNMTSKPIKDITVVDRLPKIIKPTMDFGTLHPKGVERGTQGVRIMWKIDQLVSGEERIISYKVKPSMSVIGKLDLPMSVAKFKNKHNRVTKIRSNKTSVLSGVSKDSENNKKHKKNL
jgi:hypothetical protein